MGIPRPDLGALCLNPILRLLIVHQMRAINHTANPGLGRIQQMGQYTPTSLSDLHPVQVSVSMVQSHYGDPFLLYPFLLIHRSVLLRFSSDEPPDRTMKITPLCSRKYTIALKAEIF